MTNGFVPGMRAKGECPHHPGQPFYSCPECSKSRQQQAGERIADSLQRPTGSGQAAIVPDPHPVHVTQRAQEHLLAACRKFSRERLEGRAQHLRERSEQMPAPNPEGEAARTHLGVLEARAAETGVDIDSFRVVVLVFLDILGVSGVHPKIELVEPAIRPKYQTDFREYTYPGGLVLAVELHHMNYLRGLIIDWHDRLDKSGFVIRHQQGEWRMADR